MVREIDLRLLATPTVKLPNVGLGNLSALNESERNIIHSLASVAARRRYARAATSLSDGSFPIPDVIHLKKAVLAYSLAENKPRAKRFIIRRARALRRTDLLPEAWGLAPVASTALVADGGPQHGIMVAIFPPPDVAESLAGGQDGDEPADQLHVTLAYLGTVDDVTPEQLNAARQALANVAMGQSPFNASVQGVGTFHAPESDNPQWYSVDGEGLAALRTGIVEALESVGVQPRVEHDFTPHMTVRYGGEAPEMPDLVGQDWPVDGLVLAVGGQREVYPLGHGFLPNADESDSDSGSDSGSDSLFGLFDDMDPADADYCVICAQPMFAVIHMQEPLPAWLDVMDGPHLAGRVQELVNMVGEKVEFVAAPGPCSLNKSPKHNWVEQQGGLPNYICQVARSIARNGHSLESAIPIAIGTMKRWAAGGGKVSKAVQARAASAVAEWEKMKANAGAHSTETVAFSPISGPSVSELEVTEFIYNPGEQRAPTGQFAPGKATGSGSASPADAAAIYNLLMSLPADQREGLIGKLTPDQQKALQKTMASGGNASSADNKQVSGLVGKALAGGKHGTGVSKHQAAKLTPAQKQAATTAKANASAQKQLNTAQAPIPQPVTGTPQQQQVAAAANAKAYADYTKQVQAEVAAAQAAAKQNPSPVNQLALQKAQRKLTQAQNMQTRANSTASKIGGNTGTGTNTTPTTPGPYPTSQGGSAKSAAQLRQQIRSNLGNAKGQQAVAVVDAQGRPVVDPQQNQGLTPTQQARNERMMLQAAKQQEKGGTPTISIPGPKGGSAMPSSGPAAKHNPPAKTNPAKPVQNASSGATPTSFHPTTAAKAATNPQQSSAVGHMEAVVTEFAWNPDIHPSDKHGRPITQGAKVKHSGGEGKVVGNAPARDKQVVQVSGGPNGNVSVPPNQTEITDPENAKSLDDGPLKARHAAISADIAHHLGNLASDANKQADNPSASPSFPESQSEVDRLTEKRQPYADEIAKRNGASGGDTVTASAADTENYTYYWNPQTSETFRVGGEGDIAVFAPAVDEQEEPTWQAIDTYGAGESAAQDILRLPVIEDHLTLESILGSAFGSLVASAPAEVEAPAEPGEDTTGRRFRIPILIPEGVPTGDRRMFAEGALEAKDCPMPLLWQRETDEGHKKSIIVGRIDKIERLERGGLGNAEGLFDTHADAQEAARQVRNRFLTGVSGDVDQFEHELSQNENGDERMLIKHGRLVAATLVAKPAFQEATIEMIPEEGESPVLTASAGPIAPPKAWFFQPSLDGPTQLTVTDEGRVFGHIAEWGTPHLGNPQLKPPRSRQNYRYFNRKTLRVAEGEDIKVGNLTLIGGHAKLSFDPDRAVKHYDDTQSAVADVIAGEDEFGIWVAGAMRPDVTPAQVRAFRASEPSGDWRMRDGSLELCAICQVNVPGFPVTPRALVASGEVVSLVAAGMLGREAQQLSLNETIAELQSQVAEMRAERDAERRAKLLESIQTLRP